MVTKILGMRRVRGSWLKAGFTALPAVVLVAGGVFVGAVVAQTIEKGNKSELIYQRNIADECIKPSGYKVTVKNHETIDIQFSKDGKCVERISKFYSNLPELDAEKYAILKTKQHSKSEKKSLQIVKYLSSSSKTCIATSRYTDVIYLTLTQVDSYHTFFYNGTYVTSESGYVEASYFKDGWRITSGPTFYFGPSSLPAERDYSVGKASFSWLFNKWPHTQINQITVNGDGSTSSVFVLVGDTVPGGHFLGSLDCS